MLLICLLQNEQIEVKAWNLNKMTFMVGIKLTQPEYNTFPFLQM